MTDLAPRSHGLADRDSLVPTFAGLQQAVLRRLADWQRRRREKATLRRQLELEDWQLDDIGLTRADVCNAIDLASERSMLDSVEQARQVNIGRTVRSIRRWHR